MNRKSHRERSWSLSLALALGSVSLAGISGCKSSSADVGPASAQAPAAAPVQVQTEAVALVEVPKTLRLTGTLRGNREADLAANATGRVLSVGIERGAQVKPGAVLATLDVRAATLTASEARAQAASARTQQDLARDECDVYAKLKERGALSDLEYSQRVAQCKVLPLTAEAATARAELAAQNVGDGIIRAPFAGIIAERFIEVGQYVRQDSKVATIVSLDPIRLELAVPEAEVSKVNQGAVVSFGVSAYPGRRFEGKIRFISGVVRSSTRDLVVEALVENQERLLLPGMFADVELTVGSQQLPSVPKAAVLQSEEQSRLFVVANGRVEERVVAIGPAIGERVAVVRGVAVNDRVVASDPGKLTNGQTVQ